jgi:hypothetical protein
MYAVAFALMATAALARPNDNAFRLSAPILGSPVQPNVVDYYLTAPAGASYYSSAAGNNNQYVAARSGRQEQIFTSAPVAAAVQQLSVPVRTLAATATRTVVRADGDDVIVGLNGVRSRPAPLVRQTRLSLNCLTPRCRTLPFLQNN